MNNKNNNNDEITVFDDFDKIDKDNTDKTIIDDGTVADNSTILQVDDGTVADDSTIMNSGSGTLSDYTTVDSIDENKTIFDELAKEETEDDGKTQFRGFNEESSLIREVDSQPISAPISQNNIINNIPLPVEYEFNNKYVIEKVLGQGNFGYTYLATEKITGKKVAMKEFFPRGFVGRGDDSGLVLKHNISPREQEQFKRCMELFNEEAQNLNTATTQEKSKNVVNLISFEENINNTKYYLMDYEEGDDLQVYLEEKENLSQKEILNIIEPILNGLSHIHKYGVLHKDIKPENIFIKNNGDLMLIDFGSSVQGANFYTPSYAAIEQCKRLMSEYGPYTDLYAVGVMLYEMVKGVKPPKSSVREEAFAAGKKDPYVPLSKDPEIAKGKFSKYFLSAIDWALEYSYEARPQDADIFLQYLSGGKARQKKLLIYGSILLILLITIGSYFGFRDSVGSIILPTENMENVEVQIDGKTIDKNIQNTYEVVVGRRNITFHKKDYLSIERFVNIEKGKDYTIRDIEFIPKQIDISLEVLGNNLAVIEIFNEDNTTKTLGNGLVNYTLDYTKKPIAFRASYDKYDTQIIETTYLDLVKNKKIIFDQVKIQEGVVRFQTDPEGAEVEVDRTLLVYENNNKPKLTNFSEKLTVGTYNITYFKAGYEKVEKTIKLSKNQVYAEDVVLNKIELTGNKNDKILIDPLVPTMLKLYNNIYISETEVTNDMVARFLNSAKLPLQTLDKLFNISAGSIARFIRESDNGYVPVEKFKNYPVVHISWHGAQEYIKWLNKKTKRKFRLPTVDEWKMTAEIAGNDENTINTLIYASVKSKKGSKLANGNIYDIYGNVMEWCQESVGEYNREVRGGSWKTKPDKFNTELKNFINANATNFNDVGFRLIEVK